MTRASNIRRATTAVQRAHPDLDAATARRIAEGMLRADRASGGTGRITDMVKQSRAVETAPEMTF